MKSKDINKNLSAAVSELIPKDEFDKITARLSQQPQEKAGIKMTVKKQNNNLINFKKIAGVAVAACLAVAVGLFGFNYYMDNLAVASIIDIDVNPSVELTANQQDKVLDVTAVNEDGKAILGDMDLKGTDLNVAVNAVIGAMVQGGYLEGADNEILISVKNDDKVHAEKLKAELKEDVDASLENYNVASAIINQTIDKESVVATAEDFAQSHGISIGKANFVLNLAAKDESLKAEELAGLSLREIADIVSQKKIDISDIADHDPDDSIWENIADTVEDANEEAADKADSGESASNNGVISKKKAKEIALSDAGFSESQVVFVEVKLESEKGKKVYEIEFYQGSTEYDYEIDANSGKIISSDLDIEDYEIPVASQKPASSKADSSKSVIGKASAKKAALAHAGVKSADAVFEKVELDNDDGVKHYEVEFYAGGYEYDYEIDAASGAVLKSDKEKDDDYVESKAPQQDISKSKAKKAALAHAGVKSSDAVFEKVELDNDDGVKHYDIEFKANGYEYDYEINAADGTVLKSDKEKDDDYVASVDKQSTSKISKSKAKKATLDHAGLKETDVTELSVEYDDDDGISLYEIEFKKGNVEYSYEINAADGSVISHEKEIDD